MASTSKETLYDRIVKRLRNNPIIAIGLIVFAVVVGVGAFTGGIDSAWRFVSGVVGPSAQVRKEYCDLLRPLMVELDRTKAAFDRWNQKDLSLESETIRDGNLKARALLSQKGHLLPDSLREDQKKLIFHYDRWLEEYDRVRVRRTKDPEQPFVFSFDFPRDAEERFRERMKELEAPLGSKARCVD